MNINTYYKTNLVFNTPSQVFNQDEYNFMNVLFRNKYRYAALAYESQNEIDEIVNSIISMRLPYYQAIKISYATEFDALKPIDVEETNTSSANSHEVQDYDSSYEDSGFDDGWNHKHVDDDIEYGKKDTIKDNYKDATITNEDKTSTPGVKETLTTNRTNTQLAQKTAFNTPLDFTGTDNSDASEVGSEVTERVGSDTENHNSNVTTEHTTLDKSSELSGKDSRDITGQDSHHIDTHKEGRNENDNTIDKETNSNSTIKRSGYDGIDFNEAIKAIYETRVINLYEIFMTDVYNAICYPLYEFD